MGDVADEESGVEVDHPDWLRSVGHRHGGGHARNFQRSDLCFRENSPAAFSAQREQCRKSKEDQPEAKLYRDTMLIILAKVSGSHR